jgi:hypothetical protein
MSLWNDFNSADDQQSYDVIPKGTIAAVRMTIKPGGIDDPSQGWTGGYATQSNMTGSVYLNCEFVITDGPFAKRKVWSLIGLESPKGPEWANMGRSFIKGILNSSRGLHPQNNSPQAQQARRIAGFADLDGIEFVAKIDVDKDQNGELKNIIKAAVTPDQKGYAEVKSSAAQHLTTPAYSQPAAQPAHVAQPVPSNQQPIQPSNPVPTGRPSWAQ